MLAALLLLLLLCRVVYLVCTQVVCGRVKTMRNLRNVTDTGQKTTKDRLQCKRCLQVENWRSDTLAADLLLRLVVDRNYSLKHSLRRSN